MKIRFEEQDLGSTHCYSVIVNSKRCGELCIKEDGFWDYYLEEDNNSGYLPAWFLHAVADKLDELNASWEEDINTYFENQNVKPNSK